MLPKIPSQANKRPFVGEVFTELFLEIDWPQKVRRDCVQNTLRQSLYLKPRLQAQFMSLQETGEARRRKRKWPLTLVLEE